MKTKPSTHPRRNGRLDLLSWAGLALAAVGWAVGATAAQAGTLGDALDAPQLTWTTSEDAPWFSQSATTVDGVDAAQSGAVTNWAQQSWLQTSVTGKVAVVFSWKFTTDLPANFGFYFYTNSAYIGGFNRTVDWQTKAVAFAAGTNTLRWMTSLWGTNLATGPAGAGWLDRVGVTNLEGLKPTILAQPVPFLVLPEQYPYPSNLAVTVIGDLPMSCQWQRSGTNLNEAWPIYDVTSPSLRLYPRPEAGGEYRLVASNAWGLATSAVCTVSVVAAKPFVLDNQPNDALIAAGIYHNVSANAYGTPPFGYQWFKDGAAIPAANDYYFEFGSARPADSGGYRLVVTNAYGACTSRVAQVTVSTNLPAIAQWTPSPEVLKAEPGDYVSFYGDASGPQPLTYSWRQVGRDMELSAYNDVSFDAVDPTNSGLYYFIVTNNNGAVTSRVSVLAVAPVTLLGVALDAPQQTLTNDWEYNQWAPDVTGTNAHDGWCAARTPEIGDWDAAAFSTVVTGPTNVTFWWRISAGAEAFLDLAVDGVVSNTIAGETAWQQPNIALVSGEHTLTWTYRKNQAGSVGQDAAWVDQFALGSAGGGVTNNELTNFTTGGDAAWFTQSTNTHDGVQAWQSGPLADEKQSWLETTVTGPGALTFWWAVESEACCDTLSFAVDGVALTNIAGLMSWRLESVAVAAGSHTLRWLYAKDGSDSVPRDAGWVDEVRFVPGPGEVGIPPVIVTNPVSQAVLEYYPVLFSLVATGSPPLLYQWYYYGSAIPDATNDSYFIMNAERAYQGPYHVVVANSAGRATSAVAELEVLMRPIIGSINPWSQSVVVGSNAEFYASVSATRPIAFQWYRDGVLLPGDTNINIVLTNASVGDAGSYRLAATNAYGGALSGGAQLRVLTRPEILSWPNSITRALGQSASFSVSATGAPPLFYQWRKGGTDIPGATATTYSIPSVTTNDAATYAVVITNGYGSTNTTATLSVVVPPYLLQGPSNQTVLAGSSIYLQALAGGTPTLSYRWRRFGTNLPGATASALRLAPANTNHAGPYEVVVSSSYGSVTSAPALVVINPIPSGYSPTAQDTNFATSLGADDWVGASVALPDGRWIIGGAFKTVHGMPCQAIARLNADGTVDPTFTSPFTLGTTPYLEALAVQADGRIVIGGYFSTANGGTNLARLNPDGSLDTNFVAQVGYTAGGNMGSVTCLALASGGRIVVGGRFTTINGVHRSLLGTVQANGALDPSFVPPEIYHVNLSAAVATVAVQPDGKVIYGTTEGALGAAYVHRSVYRLLATGQPDTNFVSPETVLVDGLLYGGNATYALALQPNGKLLCALESRVVRLLADGSLDTNFTIPTLTIRSSGAVQSFGLLGGAAGHDARVLIGGLFTAVNGTNHCALALLDTDGRVLANYMPGTGNDGYDYVRTLALGPDGRLLVGGLFNSLGGLPRLNLGFFSPDGTFDPTAYAGKGALGNYYGVSCVASMADGRIVIGGNFTNVNGTAVSGVARLHPDASRDPTFDIGTGPDGRVVALALQADGKLIIGGLFTNVASQVRIKLARLNVNGSVDLTFNPVLGGASVELDALAVQPSGRIVVGGFFRSVNGTAITNLARLNPDGTLDTTFAIGTGPDNGVLALAARPDGAVAVGGYFQNINGQYAPGLALLDVNGARLPLAAYPPQQARKLAVASDGTFYVGTASGGASSPTLWQINVDGTLAAFVNAAGAWYASDITALAVQPDGRLLSLGYDKTLRRFNRDRFEDPLFPTVSINGAFSLACQPDGHLLAGGNIMTVALTPGGPTVTRHGLARFNGDALLMGSARPALRVLTPWPAFSLTVQGPAGQAITLEASPDLLGWLPVWTTNLPASGSLDFTDPAAGAHARRFYRTVSP
jgi:uncharacterized delta-60 repeat protein